MFLRKMQLTSENVLSTYCSPAVSIIIFTQKEAFNKTLDHHPNDLISEVKPGTLTVLLQPQATSDLSVWPDGTKPSVATKITMQDGLDAADTIKAQAFLSVGYCHDRELKLG